MTPEQQARTVIDRLLEQSGWTVQNINNFNKAVSVGIAVREFPTNTGPVDYALFIDGKLVGIIEAKKTDSGENIISVEEQAARYASSAFKWVTEPCQIRFVYEATGDLIRFTDYADIRYRSRQVFSFHQPETLRLLLKKKDTVRNCLKKIPVLNPEGFRKCQINAIQKLDESFADNRPRALIQMATGAGKTVTAITAVYRMLKFANMNRILFLVDTKTLGEQAEQEFRRYIPNDDMRQFSNIYGVYRLKSSRMPQDVQVYISTIQRMYSILKGEELDESAEETTLFEYTNATKDKPKVVVYNQKYPPEFFDCIIVDECHRSIYNVWSQVLEYFDAFIIGLTATPDKRTFAFFHENIISQYTRDEAIADGVNVGEDIFIIETEITKNGAHLERQSIEYRNRLSRIKEWKELDEEMDYKPSQLDRSVVNPSQIRTVIRAFREALRTKKIFPDRTIVPKTLIFAKNNSHASDIVDIVREEFGEGNDFCKKITYSVEKPEEVLKAFRTGLNPRIAVTVDMIATGTDVKPIECLIFMRDVRSENYFEQMKGRGTRTLSKEELQLVTPDAKEAKDHFIIIDAVGVTKSRKMQTRVLEYQPYTSTKDLMMSAACDSKNPEILTSLANRIIRLNARMKPSERKEFEKTVGLSASAVAQNLLDAFDEEKIYQLAGLTLSEDGEEPAPEEQVQIESARDTLLQKAVQPFHKPETREFIENIRKNHEQLLDNVNIDTLLTADYASNLAGNAEKIIADFHRFIEENKNEILALRILYDQRYKDRPMVLEQLKALAEKMKQSRLSVKHIWNAYATLHPEKVKSGTIAQLADLISLIRFEMGVSKRLQPFSARVDYNFMQWTLRRNAGAVHFTDEQMKWLRAIKDHISASLSIEPEDLELNPFDSMGGLGKFYQLFGDSYQEILTEMNLELVA